MTTYGQRLEEALAIAGKDRQQLSDEIGISVQAISQVILGKTKALTAENSALAAKFAGVDGFWLATGVGSPLMQAGNDHPWPFAISREEYDRLSAAQKAGLDRILTEFIRSSLEGRDEWGSPKPEGIVSTAPLMRRSREG
ncbi:helix-turn-helix domain-containing protein [Cupriavidus basilensis]